MHQAQCCIFLHFLLLLSACFLWNLLRPRRRDMKKEKGEMGFSLLALVAALWKWRSGWIPRWIVCTGWQSFRPRCTQLRWRHCKRLCRASNRDRRSSTPTLSSSPWRFLLFLPSSSSSCSFFFLCFTPLPSLSPSLLWRSHQCSYVVCKDHHTNGNYCVSGLNRAMRQWQKFLPLFFFEMQFLLNSCHGGSEGACMIPPSKDNLCEVLVVLWRCVRTRKRTSPVSDQPWF